MLHPSYHVPEWRRQFLASGWWHSFELPGGRRNRAPRASLAGSADTSGPLRRCGEPAGRAQPADVTTSAKAHV
jgi:hypothetical protein